DGRGLETALGVERFGAAGGAGDKQPRLDGDGELRRLFHQLAADAAAPEIRFHERAVDIGIAVFTGYDDDETRRRAPVFEDDDKTGGYVIGRQLQRLWVLHLLGPIRVPFR